jgi:ppGpp synthetase/RelA/SpoT-type nucleotidyltranferase
MDDKGKLLIHDLTYGVSEFYCDSMAYLRHLIQGELARQEARDVQFSDRLKDPREIEKKATQRQWSAEQALMEMKDLLGLRIICSHLEEAEQMVAIVKALAQRGHFDCDLADEKDNLRDPRPGGYRGWNLPISLSQPFKSEGHLKEITIKCEIQVQTHLQNAWTEITHYLTYKPPLGVAVSQPLRDLFSFQSDGLFIAQLEMDRLRDLVMREQQEAGAFDIVTFGRFFREHGEDVSEKQLIDQYRQIRQIAEIKSIHELDEILKKLDDQTSIERAYRSILGRDATVVDRVLYGAMLRGHGPQAIFEVERNLMSLEEFRSGRSRRLEFSVIGRTDHKFSKFWEYSGGWLTYHTRTHTGRVSTYHNPAIDSDCALLEKTGDDDVFRIRYPAVFLGFPGSQLQATLHTRGDFYLHVLVRTELGKEFFLEYRTKPFEKVIAFDPSGMMYVRHHRQANREGVLFLEENLEQAVADNLPEETINSVEAFFFAVEDVVSIGSIGLTARSREAKQEESS